MKKKVLVVFGTRPEAIKMAPVIQALKRHPDSFKLVVCVTGQHRHILDQMLSFFEVEPDIDLQLMSPNQSLSSLTAKTVETVSEVIERIQPDVTLVQGDTTTAMISGLSSFYAKVPVGHVEAGLRTDNIYDPFPEEINRRLLTQLTSFHFAPTEASAARLAGEGNTQEKIFITGKTVIDALLWAAPRVKKTALSKELCNRKFILVTAHRRENFGKPIENVCAAIKAIVKENDIDIVYPVHPNPNINEPVFRFLNGVDRVHLIEPLDYENFIAFMKDATLLLSDSGGVQEEAPSLGKPVLVLRKTTERPEAVASGVAKLVGTDPKKIAAHVKALLVDPNTYDEMSKASNPFGDGSAAEQIVSILKSHL